MTTTTLPPVPAPAACAWCDGSRCAACHQTGVAPVVFPFGISRTYRGGRDAEYTPTARDAGLLVLTCRKTEGGKAQTSRYAVQEFACDFHGRAFFVGKVKRKPGEKPYQVFLGADGSATCSCPGESYQSAAKANERAYQAGEETFRTAGCKHADSCRALLAGGFFDLEAK